jgi:hypothetical protein
MSNVRDRPAKLHAPEPESFVTSQSSRDLSGECADDLHKLLMTIVGHAELLATGNLSLETQTKYIGRIASATRKLRDQVSRAANSQIARD